jgi:trehalose 6-phosphate phosphatase
VEAWSAAFGPVLADPMSAAILTDFDGTLSPIVTDPLAAAPLPGAVDVLRRLAARLALVGVVSGRPVAYLRDQLGDDLWLSGLYGLESFVDGDAVELAEAADWREVVTGATQRAAGVFGDAVEPKGLSLTVHFRARPERGPEVRAWADKESTRSGLVVRAAKASIELHPPVSADKGSVVERAAAGLRSVCFLGDDVGDLPAFAALDRLVAAGVHAVKIAVSTEEAPVAVLEGADVVVDGPEGALALLTWLVEQLDQTDAS